MTREEMKELLQDSEGRIDMMMDAKLNAMERRLENTLAVELKAIHKKLDHLQFQMDTVYNWVDQLDINVKEMKRDAK